MLAKTRVRGEHLTHRVDRRNSSSKPIKEPSPAPVLREILLHGVMVGVPQTHYSWQDDRRGKKYFTNCKKSPPEFIAKMNTTLTIEPLNSTYPAADPQCLPSSPDTTSESQAESGEKVRPSCCSHLKFEERFDTLIAMLSLVYLMGGIGFGGLLLFYALSR